MPRSRNLAAIWVLLLFAVVDASVNVTMASLSFVSNIINQSISNIEEASLAKVAEMVDRVVQEGSDVVALPEGYFWWYLPTRKEALEHAPPFIAVVDGISKDNGLKINPCNYLGDTTSAIVVFKLSCQGQVGLYCE